MRRAALVAVLLLPPATTWADRTVTGTVFVDVDGDALLSAPDRVVTGGVVFWEAAQDAPIDELGGYELSVPERPGIVWVLARDGLDPGPFWAAVPAGGDHTADIAVRRPKGTPAGTKRPLSRTGPLTFVVASDTHAGIHGMPASDQVLVLQQATDLEPRPHFIAVTGDLTQSKPEQFATVLAAAAAIDTPYVPVPGNHDWYDGGAAYRRHLGPPTYAFNAGGAHFIVLNDASSLDERVRFVERDLALLTGDPTVVAFMHAPPGDELVAALAARGVDALLTGHMHSNRLLRHDGLVEYNTEPLAMGGMDLTPAGYRVFSLAADGSLRAGHRTLVNRPVLRIVAPAADQIAPRCRVPVVVAVEVGTPVVSLAARVEGVGDVALVHAGGWAHAAEPLNLCEPGAHRIEVAAVLADGYALTDSVDVVVGDPPAVAEVRDWTALQGSTRHLGWSPVETGFPLRTQWVASAGGHVQGAPVVAGGRVFVPVSDLAAGADGGVAAFDAATGGLLWQRRVGAAVRNAPAVEDGVVVFAALDGSVNTVDAVTGEERWTAALAPWAAPSSRSLYAAPIIADGVVYAGGGRELAALELQSGEVLWTASPIAPGVGELESHASPALADGLLVTAFDRGEQGVMAFAAATGELVWQTAPEVAQDMQGSPAIAGRTVYVVNERRSRERPYALVVDARPGRLRLGLLGRGHAGGPRRRALRGHADGRDARARRGLGRHAVVGPGRQPDHPHHALPRRGAGHRRRAGAHAGPGLVGQPRRHPPGAVRRRRPRAVVRRPGRADDVQPGACRRADVRGQLRRHRARVRPGAEHRCARAGRRLRDRLGPGHHGGGRAGRPAPASATLVELALCRPVFRWAGRAPLDAALAQVGDEVSVSAARALRDPPARAPARIRPASARP